MMYVLSGFMREMWKIVSNEIVDAYTLQEADIQNLKTICCFIGINAIISSIQLCLWTTKQPVLLILDIIEDITFCLLTSIMIR